MRLCREFKCLPSAIEQEDVNIIRLLVIEDMGTKREEEPDA